MGSAEAWRQERARGLEETVTQASCHVPWEALCAFLMIGIPRVAPQCLCFSMKSPQTLSVGPHAWGSVFQRE